MDRIAISNLEIPRQRWGAVPSWLFQLNPARVQLGPPVCRTRPCPTLSLPGEVGREQISGRLHFQQPQIGPTSSQGTLLPSDFPTFHPSLFSTSSCHFSAPRRGCAPTSSCDANERPPVRGTRSICPPHHRRTFRRATCGGLLFGSTFCLPCIPHHPLNPRHVIATAQHSTAQHNSHHPTIHDPRPKPWMARHSMPPPRRRSPSATPVSGTISQHGST